jgi:glyoxylase-like metal-dependent hydrolase (beta-lactamase superfamily II)
MANRVFAIRYAHNAETRASENFYGFDIHDGSMPLDYFMWAVVGDDGSAIVVDAGISPETAVRRNHTLLCDPIDVLAALGVEAAAVRDVVLTHLHYDHVGCVSAFPKAQFWLQDREMAFWTGRYAARGELGFVIEPDDVCAMVRLNYDRRLRFVDGEGQVTPAITLHHVGGHSPGLQVARIETGNGPLVLASDASHYYANVEQDRPFSIVNSLPDMYAAFDRLNELAGSSLDIIPGHDPLVMERYAPVSPDLEGYAVELVSGRQR